MGPWMKYVNAFMMPNSKLLVPLAPVLPRLLFRDFPKDVNPSQFLR